MRPLGVSYIIKGNTFAMSEEPKVRGCLFVLISFPVDSVLLTIAAANLQLFLIALMQPSLQNPHFQIS